MVWRSTKLMLRLTDVMKYRSYIYNGIYNEIVCSKANTSILISDEFTTLWHRHTHRYLIHNTSNCAVKESKLTPWAYMSNPFQENSSISSSTPASSITTLKRMGVKKKSRNIIGEMETMLVHLIMCFKIRSHTQRFNSLDFDNMSPNKHRWLRICVCVYVM